jgi:hypothetical protein
MEVTRRIRKAPWFFTSEYRTVISNALEDSNRRLGTLDKPFTAK